MRKAATAKQPRKSGAPGKVKVDACRFCGNARIEVSRRMDGGFSCFCSQCSASGPWHDTKRKAVEAWNRTPVAIFDEELADTIAQVEIRIQSCKDEIAKTNSTKYVPEDEDDEEGHIARIDLPFYRQVLKMLTRGDR